VPLALITGASTGIGRATALRLASTGWTVLAGVRGEEAGERLRADAGGDARMIPVALDVTDPAQVAAAAERVRELAGDRNGAAGPGSRGGLDGLVNNAGIVVGGPLEVVSGEELRTQFEVNVFGQVAVTRALLPALRAAGGRIVFVSSIGGRVATPFIAPYAASKYAIEAIADALRVELHRSRVRVALVEPGSVATPIWDKGRDAAASGTLPPELEDAYAGVIPAMEKVLEDTASRGVPPEVVAETIERALTSPRHRARYLVGRDARIQLLVRRLLPDLAFDRLIRRVMNV
jgi:NAD(P)-dependent dehydrogenase (short-subunit alcohol dehydrogenase family)